MSKKLPELYKGNDFSKVNNNKKVCYVCCEKNENTESDANDILLDDYILNTPVNIITKTSTYNTRIVSRQKDHILTSNNKIIMLDQIISIRK